MEFIDGHPVMEHQVRFRLRATINEADAGLVRDGDTMVWLVRTRCLPPQYHAITKEGDERYKLAVQDVEAATPLAGALREQALGLLNGQGDQLALPFHGEDELSELRGLLAGLGELRDGERLADAVRRLIESRTPAGEAPDGNTSDEAGARTGAERYLDERREDPEYAAAYERATAVLHADEPDSPQPVWPPPSDFAPDDVEIVGTLRPGGRSKLSDLLDSAFEDHR